MAFLAPLLVPFIGTIGAALVEIGASLGLSFLANKLGAKKSSGSSGQSLSLSIDPSAPRQWPVGQVGNAGSLAYWQLSGTHNHILHLVIALADVEVQALVTTSIFVDGKAQTIDGSGFVSGYNNKLKVTFHTGSATQTADAAVIAASGGRWTSTEVGKYTAYAVVEATYDPPSFPNGIPKFVFVMQGAKLYDFRLDTTAGGSGSQRWNDPTTWTYTANAVVALYNFMRGIAPGGVPLMGMFVAASALRYADWAAAANSCDEAISLAAGGTEPRYQIGAVFDTNQTNREIIQAFNSAYAGDLIECGGIYRPIVGVAQSSVVTITDADLIPAKPLQSDPKHSRAVLTNAVYGSYSDPTRAFASVPLPPRTSSSDETADGGHRYTQTLDLTAVTSRTQAQRCMEVARKLARRQLTVTGTLRAALFGLEVGDWLTYNSTRRGYVNRTFEVSQIATDNDLNSDVTLIEVDAGIDDWTTGDELADNQVTNLASAGPPLSSVSGLVVQNVTVSATGGVQRPGILLTWTAVNDPTVLSLHVEYRKVGDTVALTIDILDPTSGSYTFVNGIQTGLQYEVRMIPVTRPARSLTYTAWTQPTGTAANQVVPVSNLANSAAPGSITPAMLSAQAAFELSLATAISTLQGSVADRLQTIVNDVQALSTALLQHWVKTGNLNASVSIEQAIRQSLSDAFAQYQVQTNAIINDPTSGNTALSVAQLLLQSTVTTLKAGAEARAFLGVSVSGGTGTVTGGIDVYANSLFSIISFLADKFVIARPDGSGATQIFTAGTINGVTNQVGITGNVIIDGSIIARHLSVSTLSAIVADLGTVTAGYMHDPSNLFYIDLTNGKIGTTDGKVTMDFFAKTDVWIP